MLKWSVDVLKHRSNACFSRLQHVDSVCEPPTTAHHPRTAERTLPVVSRCLQGCNSTHTRTRQHVRHRHPQRSRRHKTTQHACFRHVLEHKLVCAWPDD